MEGFIYLSYALQIALGILVADFISGIVHWLEDNYGREEWPILGPIVIEPNIRHHYAPLDFTIAPYWRRNRAVFVLVAFVGAVLYFSGGLNVFSCTILLVSSQANEVHRFAHLPTKKVPTIVRKLQRLGLMQSAQHHWVHHRKPFKQHYCTITNYLNPALDKIGFFDKAQAIIQALTGVTPRDDTQIAEDKRRYQPAE